MKVKELIDKLNEFNKPAKYTKRIMECINIALNILLILVGFVLIMIGLTIRKPFNITITVKCWWIILLGIWMILGKIRFGAR